MNKIVLSDTVLFESEYYMINLPILQDIVINIWLQHHSERHIKIPSNILIKIPKYDDKLTARVNYIETQTEAIFIHATTMSYIIIQQ